MLKEISESMLKLRENMRRRWAIPVADLTAWMQLQEQAHREMVAWMERQSMDSLTGTPEWFRPYLRLIERVAAAEDRLSEEVKSIGYNPTPEDKFREALRPDSETPLTLFAPTPGRVEKPLRSGTVSRQEIGEPIVRAILAASKSTKFMPPGLVEFWSDSSSLTLTLRWPSPSGANKGGARGPASPVDGVVKC